MSVFKCKMCGGTIEFEPGSTVGVCEYCGTKQTLPKLDDDKKANLYDRANHFRRSNDFDKAANIYEQILAEDNTDSEAYWSLVLCRYGIEYVEDPSTHSRIPTVNRAQFTSIYADEDYKSAIEYADNYQKEIYELEAKQIDEIQKGILAISNKEEPFDIFICYKETDNNGRRTMDSVLANDLYHQLVIEGFKVFFSRITLEDKLGTAYEPYIFAALNSSKVMVVLGTKPEYFNAVWVKNEWSRYLSLVKQSKGKKVLIPAYRDMDPYDLPEEFSHLQALDMSKLGFMQDLIRGIKKIIQTDAPTSTIKETIITNNNNTNTAPLLKRVFMFLEDGNFTEANEYCEKVLDIDPENAYAYLGKLMAELQVRKQESLKDQKKSFDNSSNYQKAIRFGDEKLSSTLSGYISYINERNENTRLTNAYDRAKHRMESAITDEDFRNAAEIFNKISNFKDSTLFEKQCIDKANEIKEQREKNIDEALKLVDMVIAFKKNKSGESLESLRQKFEELKDFSLQFSQITNEINELESKKNSIENEISNLRNTRASLGLFAGKEKKITDEKINAKETESRKLVASINDLKPKLNGYSSIDKINKEMDALKKTIVEKEEIENKLNTLISYDEAVKKLSEFSKIPEIKKAIIENGNIITFGEYPFSRDAKRMPIEWEVLDILDGKALVISKYGLDAKPYNIPSKRRTIWSDTIWRNCSLRSWLNNDFLMEAFSNEEQSTIVESTVINYTKANPGIDTTDKIFLLSITEVGKYFNSDSDRVCTPTAYAVAKGAYESDSGSCWWWLRSPGHPQNRAASVDCVGSIFDFGNDVGTYDECVRPALWINLDQLF